MTIKQTNCTIDDLVHSVVVVDWMEVPSAAYDDDDRDGPLRRVPRAGSNPWMDLLYE